MSKPNKQGFSTSSDNSTLCLIITNEYEKIFIFVLSDTETTPNSRLQHFQLLLPHLE